jgi:glycine cleavage system H protein
MGMDDFAQKMAGEIVYVQLPDEGKALKVGKKFAKIESGKWLGKVYAPVNGELVAVNEELETNPGLINEDCYGKGWMYKISPDDKAELADLIRGREAVEKWLLEDIEKYAQEE